MEPTVIVTGAAGFIGSAVIWALNRRGRTDILAVDLLGEGDKFRNLVPLAFHDYLEADAFLRKIEASDEAFPGVRTVYHLGANSATTERNNRHLIEVNYEFTKTLAAWCLRRGARLVYASSAATYGDGAAGMDDGAPIDALRPLNMYGYSKHLFDLYARRAGWLERVAGMKYFNVFGPNEAHKGDMKSVIPKAFAQIRETGRVGLFKSYHPDFPDGGQRRDFLYVKDAVEMTVFLGENPLANGLFNLGSGVASSWIEFVTPVFDALRLPPKIDFIEMPEALRGKYQYFTRAEIGRLRAAGYAKALTPLSAAVRDYVQNYLVPDRRLDPLA